MNIREDIRRELEETRRAYYALMAEISPEDWHKPAHNPAWDVGEMLYHITVAPRLMTADLGMIRRFQRLLLPPAFIFHRLNEWNTKRGARRNTLETIHEAYDEAHRRVLAALQTIRDDEWQKGAVYPGWDPMLDGFVTIEMLFRYVKRHYDAHAVEVRDALSLR